MKERAKLLLALAALTLSGDIIAAEPTYHFEIKAQSLRSAVPEFSRQAGRVNFALSDGAAAMHIQVNAVSGTLTRDEALRRMLASTGVTYKALRPNLFVFTVPK